MSYQLTDHQWKNIQDYLKQHPYAYVGNPTDCRRFIEGVGWIPRSGAQWRFLPEAYGDWNAVYKRFRRWSDNGVWEAMHQTFSEDADMEAVMIDSTVVRAHACAAGGKRGSVTRPLTVPVVVFTPKYTPL